MRQWKALLAGFSTGQRIALVLAAVTVASGLVVFTRWRRESDFRPLYTGLEPADAAALVARLKEGSVEYRLSEDGRTVSAPSARVAELRLTMASAGLPKNGRIGFELFDRTNFGATEFAEQINYGRALEGELERSVASMAEVEQARVHLTFPKDSVFTESRQPAKASVLVKLKPGTRLNAQNIQAVCHLVSSAVQGLAPEAVSVVDMDGNLLNRPRKAASMDGAEPSDALIDFRQSLERDLLVKINSTLEPLLGAEKFRASVSIDCDFTSGEQSEETFDPARSVMLTSETTEDATGTPVASGVPGTASNLPRPSSRPGTAQAGISRRTENVTYQSSRVVRRLRLPLGAVKRVSAAVLVDNDLKWVGKGAAMQRSLEPPPPDRLKAIHDLVAGAIGFTPARGDQLVVESLPFDSTLHFEPPASGSGPPPKPGAPTWLEKIGATRAPVLVAAAGAGMLVLAAALWLLLRRKSQRKGATIASQPELSAAQRAEAAGVAVQSAERPSTGQPMRELPPPPPKRSDGLADSVREMVKQDPAASAQVFRTWLADEEG